MHEKRPNQESEALAVTDLLVVEAEALEDSPQTPLTLTIGIPEHIDAREASSEILADEALIWAGFTTQSLVNFMQTPVLCESHALPYYPSKRRRDTLPDLVGEQCGQSGSRLPVVPDKSRIELQVRHGRRWEYRVAKGWGLGSVNHLSDLRHRRWSWCPAWSALRFDNLDFDGLWVCG